MILAPIGCGPIHAKLLCHRVCKSIRFVIRVRTLATWSALDECGRPSYLPRLFDRIATTPISWLPEAGVPFA